MYIEKKFNCMRKKLFQQQNDVQNEKYTKLLEQYQIQKISYSISLSKRLKVSCWLAEFCL